MDEQTPVNPAEVPYVAIPFPTILPHSGSSSNLYTEGNVAQSGGAWGPNIRNSIPAAKQAASTKQATTPTGSAGAIAQCDCRTPPTGWCETIYRTFLLRIVRLLVHLPDGKSYHDNRLVRPQYAAIKCEYRFCQQSQGLLVVVWRKAGKGTLTRPHTPRLVGQFEFIILQPPMGCQSQRYKSFIVHLIIPAASLCAIDF